MSEWCELDEMEARTLKRFPDVSGILMELAHAIARGEIGYRRIEGAKVVSVGDEATDVERDDQKAPMMASSRPR